MNNKVTIDKSFYDNGNTKYEYGYIKPSKDSGPIYDGFYRKWYINGQICIEGHMEAGKEVGKWTRYFPSGKIERMYSFIKKYNLDSEDKRYDIEEIKIYAYNVGLWEGEGEYHLTFHGKVEKWKVITHNTTLTDDYHRRLIVHLLGVGQFYQILVILMNDLDLDYINSIIDKKDESSLQFCNAYLGCMDDGFVCGD